MIYVCETKEPNYENLNSPILPVIFSVFFPRLIIIASSSFDIVFL